VAQLVKLYGI